ncbi:Uncharacterised protein [uncultured archaeon]|nr:Uncharacterised protein [uncultured archaeon]
MRSTFAIDTCVVRRYIVFAYRRICQLNSLMMAIIQNGNIDIDTIWTYSREPYVAFFDASAFGAAGNSDMKGIIFKLLGRW